MLRKNVGSQVVTFCLVNATTGAALTGATVTPVVTVDGTQAAGLGTVTSLGTGQYKYVPTQAETNGASIGFGFTATNAVPVNLQCFTIGQDPTQTTFQADVAKWLATAVSTPTVAGVPNVNAKTWNDLATVALPLIPTTAGRTLDVSATGEAGVDWANIGGAGTSVNLSSTTISVVGTASNLITNNDKTGYTLSAAGIQAVWDALTSALTTVGSIGKLLVTNVDAAITSRLAPTVAARTLDVSAGGEAGVDWANIGSPTTSNGLTGTTIATSQVVASVSGNVGGVTGVTFPATVASPTNITAGTITTVTNLTNAPTAGDFTATMKTSITTAVPTAAAIGTAVWAVVADGTATAMNLLRGIASSAFGKLSGAATATVTIRNQADTKNVIVATVDSDGNRSAVTTDLT